MWFCLGRFGGRLFGGTAVREVKKTKTVRRVAGHKLEQFSLRNRLTLEGKDYSLPGELLDIVDNENVSMKWASVATTYYIHNNNGLGRYLKIQPLGHVESIEIQANKLLWLKDKLPVPTVLDYGKRGNYEYLLTLEIEGLEASNDFFRTRLQDTIPLLAQGLKTIHHISIDHCPFDNSLGKLLMTARLNYENKKLDQEEIYRKFGEKDLEKLMHELEGTASDKSIIRNFGKEYVPLFFQEYGINEVDFEKVRFYQILECFI